MGFITMEKKHHDVEKIFCFFNQPPNSCKSKIMPAFFWLPRGILSINTILKSTWPGATSGDSCRYGSHLLLPRGTLFWDFFTEGIKKNSTSLTGWLFSATTGYVYIYDMMQMFSVLCLFTCLETHLHVFLVFTLDRDCIIRANLKKINKKTTRMDYSLGWAKMLWLITHRPNKDWEASNPRGFLPWCCCLR